LGCSDLTGVHATKLPKMSRRGGGGTAGTDGRENPAREMVPKQGSGKCDDTKKTVLEHGEKDSQVPRVLTVRDEGDASTPVETRGQ